MNTTIKERILAIPSIILLDAVVGKQLEEQHPFAAHGEGFFARFSTGTDPESGIRPADNGDKHMAGCIRLGEGKGATFYCVDTDAALDLAVQVLDVDAHKRNSLRALVRENLARTGQELDDAAFDRLDLSGIDGSMQAELAVRACIDMMRQEAMTYAGAQG